MHISALLRGVFPHDVATCECVDEGDPEWLMTDELEQVAHAAPKRIKEFAAGRMCARRCLSAIGVEGFALRQGADRRPIWPHGVVGSITHTDGFCGAAAASANAYISLGLDAENIERLQPSLWSMICTSGERLAIEALPPDRRQTMAALIFSAKECFYKYQYALTGRWLDFHDLAVHPRSRRFEIEVLKPGAIGDDLLRRMDCRYAIDKGRVITAIAGAASGEGLDRP